MQYRENTALFQPQGERDHVASVCLRNDMLFPGTVSFDLITDSVISSAERYRWRLLPEVDN